MDTNFDSPSGGEVMLRVNYAAAAIKVFLNGRNWDPRGQEVKVTLEKAGIASW